ncbi:anti-repressor protein [Candidatus Magnetobacterium bavaricum]|uniref:Anti-repressor protein n=1 Tax=Candidatus Magnetobacterium bavaricum TaxID=29290 RepID=A0A0F3GYM4_9BACT|nr:anti-repressor protein [Candidatus Magnetobacterium bavaricum]
MTTFTTSGALADKSGKPHEEVLQVIKTLPCSDVYRRQNIEAVMYHDACGELQVQYRLSREAAKMVMIILMGNLDMSTPEPPPSPTPASSTITRALQLRTSRMGNESIQTVNAKNLHAWLEVKTGYNAWIKRRIEENGFVKDIDYVEVLIKNDQKSIHADSRKRTPDSGRPETEHHLTLDMAKQIAAAERNDKGKEARLYFIACEKEMKRLQSLPPSGPIDFKLSPRGSKGLQALGDILKEVAQNSEAKARLQDELRRKMLQGDAQATVATRKRLGDIA